MGFTSTINLSRVLKTRVFDVSANRAITVICDGRMDRPGPCAMPAYSIELVQKGILLDSSKGARSYPANGVAHTETWSGLPSGRYSLVISINNSNPNCRLIGTINVTT